MLWDYKKVNSGLKFALGDGGMGFRALADHRIAPINPAFPPRTLLRHCLPKRISPVWQAEAKGFPEF